MAAVAVIVASVAVTVVVTIGVDVGSGVVVVRELGHFLSLCDGSRWSSSGFGGTHTDDDTR